MQASFQSPHSSASSAIIEEGFKDLRSYIPVARQAHKFVLLNLNYVESEVILAQVAFEAEFGIPPTNYSNITSKSLINNDILINDENINTKKPLVKDASVKKISSKNKYDYSKRKNTKSSLSVKTSFGVRKTFLNANHIEGGVYISEKLMFFTNTCAYDSIFEILVDLYEGSQIFMTHVKKYSKDNSTFKLVVDYVSSGYNEDLFYEVRGKILSDLKTSTIKGNQVHCDCCVLNLFDAIFDKCSFIEELKLCNNNACSSKAVIDSNVIHLNDSHIEILRNESIESAIKNSFLNDDFKCYLCQETCSTIFSEKYINLLPVSIESLSYNQFCLVNDLPETISVQNKIYRLSGIIAFSGNIKLGHYVAYSKVKGKWKMRNDMKIDQEVVEYNSIPLDTIVSLVFYARIHDLDKPTINSNDNNFETPEPLHEDIKLKIFADGTVDCDNSLQKDSNFRNDFDTTSSRHTLIIHALNCETSNKYFKHDQIVFQVSNTCPFDSISELLIATYKRSDSFKRNVLEATTSEPINIFKSIFMYLESINSYDISSFYKDRFNIMYNIGEKNFFDKTSCILDCNYNICKLFEILVKNICHSFLQCTKCGNKTDNFIIVVSMKHIIAVADGVRNLQTAIDNCLKNEQKYCDSCQ